MLSEKPDHIKWHLVHGFERLEFSRYLVTEIEYLVIICECFGDKSKALPEILTGAASNETTASRWDVLKKFHRDGLIYEERGTNNEVLIYHYHDDLPALLHTRFASLFNEKYTPTPEKILTVSLNSSLSGSFVLPNAIYLRPNTPYFCEVKSTTNGMVLEIRTVV